MLRHLVEGDLKARGRTARTIYEWGLIADDFQKLCGLKAQYTRADVIAWLAAQRARGVSPHSIQVRLYVIRLIFEILETPFPSIKLAKPSPDTIQRPTFTKEEVITLISRCPSSCSIEEACYLALSTIYGLRVIELTRISPEDLLGKFRVYTAKGGRITEHIIPSEIQRYLIPLHPSNEQKLNKLFHDICRKTECKFRKGYAWHAIRRAVATELILADASALNVARFMRWSNSRISWEFGILALYAKGDQESIDRAVFEKHPFLPYWRPSERA